MDISTENQQTFIKIGKIYTLEFQNSYKKIKDLFTDLEDFEGKPKNKHCL